MLYDEVKAKQTFSYVMNGAVSHELRNPLYALVGGIDSLKYYSANLKYLIKMMKDDDNSFSID